ncbi:MAG: peptidylprolyl isomerase [Deltaproteobacteria bacterium]|nr:peptidylprolyl isomerase [Deltaproteobacteria bacterium]
MRKIFLVLLLVCIGMSGCTKNDDKAGVNEAVQKNMAEKASLDTDIVARVGDEVITRSDLGQILAQIPLQYRSRYSSAQGMKELTDRLVEMKMLAWEARKQGVDKRPDMKMKLNNMIDQILARELEEGIKKTLNIDEKDIENYYKENQDSYNTPSKVKASHILVESKDEAVSILKALRGGADFKELAREKSKCPSASKGGDLGWFEKGKMDPAFEKAAFDLKKGEISDVVKSSFGYHIIKVENIRPARTKTIDQAKKSIEKTLERDLLEKQMAELKARIKNEIAVEVNQEYFKALASEEGAPEEAKKESKEPMTKQGE